MYLSQLILNPRSRQARRELGNPYQLHRTVMSAFPETLPENERVLYRLDTHPRSNQIALLVQSQGKPDWSRLAERDILLPADPFYNLDNPAVKAVNLTVQPGQILRFRLRANPVKKLFKDEPERNLKKGQRIGLLREDDQRAWLDRKGEDGGFKVLSVNIINEGFSGGWTKEKHKLKHFAVRFDGVLQVTNPAHFLKTLNSGIGRGKGFGFGLLSLASG
jgi:CRISPR system Cascade subunit CasE